MSINWNFSIFCLSLLLFICLKSYSQFIDRSSIANGKSEINLNELKNWQTVHSGKLSNNGEFVSYYINNELPGRRKLVVQSLNSAWKKEFWNTSGEVFSTDSKYFIFKRGSDSVVILNLKNKQAFTLTGITDFELTNQSSNWLIYKSTSQEIKAYEISTGKKLQFKNVDDYRVIPGRNTLFLIVNDDRDNKNKIKLVNLSTGLEKVIWVDQKGDQTPKNIAFDNEGGGKVVFSVEDSKKDGKSYSLWYFDMTKENSDLLTSNEDIQREFSGFHLVTSNIRFTRDGKGIFIGIEPDNGISVDKNKPSVDVWSFNDRVLQSLQIQEKNKRNVYTCVVNVIERKIYEVEREDEKIVEEGGSYVLLERKLGFNGIFESAWNKSARISYYIVSLIDGARKLIKEGITNFNERCVLSPNGKWVVFYDLNKKHFFSFDTNTSNTIDITNLAINWEDENSEYPEPALNGWPMWAGDSMIFLNDTYDVWMIDLCGKNKPKNLTNGYGRRNSIKFRLVKPNGEPYSLQNNQNIYFEAFNLRTKERGYFSKKIRKDGDPQLLFMGKFTFGIWTPEYAFNLQPSKALYANVFLDVRSSDVDAPNYFVTKDYKTFRFLTNVRPQKNYNWYTNELHSWKSLDGNLLQGILYKPENFDSTKKYPVIFQYYEKRSERLNLFLRPEASNAEINIPFFVSRGYLVFVPDIYYRIGHPGESAYNSVISAANYLKTKIWVDPNKLGLQGHSFGGFETAYIITHTNVFAAACAASGIYDLMAWYGSGARGGYPIYHLERNQAKMKGTPWEIKNLYINNSPIYNADKVTTPLLMMQNKDDRVVPFAQGVEFFTSLRRLSKKVWMLQYDGEDHTLEIDGRAAIDFSNRMVQFFDFYLKNSLLPKWMAVGVPAKLKGVESGFDFYNSNDIKLR
jgi:dipeptidyl aminopeptidase/acylaminoacyl peptidase